MNQKFIQYLIHSALVSLFICISGLSSAQQMPADTLRLTIPKAEQIFIEKNLILLANQYNIDINKALVQQAKVWDNPVLNTDQNIYDGKFLGIQHKMASSTGRYLYRYSSLSVRQEK